MDEDDVAPQFERIREAFVKLGDAARAMGEAVQSMARAIERFVIPVIAAAGIADLELDLKLVAETGLRTDLLALFDPDP